MVEQNARQALEIADRGYVLVQGENRYTDTGKALLADPEVRRAFLGDGDGRYTQCPCPDCQFRHCPRACLWQPAGLGALGVTMIYSILRFSNFAHGEMMSFGAMITILLTWYLQHLGVGLGPLPTALIALPVGIVATIILALSVDGWCSVITAKHARKA